MSLSFLINRSFLVIEGSSVSPTPYLIKSFIIPISPPGTAYKRSFFSALRLTILLLIGLHSSFFV